MDEIKFQDRFEPAPDSSSLFQNVYLIVDATECAIQRPSSYSDRMLYSSGRNKENTHGRYSIKYTVAVQIVTGKICFLSGPEPGSVADVTAFRISGISDRLILNEVILGDKGYQGLPDCLSPFKGKKHQLSPIKIACNEVIASVRQMVECLFKRMKHYKVLEEQFRCELEKHRPVFNVVANITNIAIERSPIWLHENLLEVMMGKQHE